MTAQPTDLQPSELAPAPAAAARSAVEFRVSRPGMPLRRLRLAGTRYTFGYGPEATVRLDDSSLQPIHAVLTREQEQLLLRSVNSLVTVNGQAVTTTVLKPGDHFQLGQFDFQLIAAAAEPLPTPLRQQSPHAGTESPSSGSECPAAPQQPAPAMRHAQAPQAEPELPTSVSPRSRLSFADSLGGLRTPPTRAAGVKPRRVSMARRPAEPASSPPMVVEEPTLRSPGMQPASPDEIETTTRTEAGLTAPLEAEHSQPNVAGLAEGAESDSAGQQPPGVAEQQNAEAGEREAGVMAAASRAAAIDEELGPTAAGEAADHPAILANERRWQERSRRQIARHRQREARHRKQIEALRVAQQEAERRAEESQSEVREVREQLAELAERVAMLAKSALPGLEERLEQQTCEAAISTQKYQELIESLCQRLDAVQEAIDGVQRDACDIRQQTVSVREDQREVLANAELLEQMVQQLSESRELDRAGQSAELNEMRDHLRELSSKLSHTSGQLSETRDSSQALNVQIEQLRRSLLDMQSDSQRFATIEQIDSVENQLRMTDARLRELFADYDSQAVQLREECELLRQRIEEQGQWPAAAAVEPPVWSSLEPTAPTAGGQRRGAAPVVDSADADRQIADAVGPAAPESMRIPEGEQAPGADSKAEDDRYAAAPQWSTAELHSGLDAASLTRGDRDGDWGFAHEDRSDDDDFADWDSSYAGQTMVWSSGPAGDTELDDAPHADDSELTTEPEEPVAFRTEMFSPTALFSQLEAASSPDPLADATERSAWDSERAPEMSTRAETAAQGEAGEHDELSHAPEPWETAAQTYAVSSPQGRSAAEILASMGMSYADDEDDDSDGPPASHEAQTAVFSASSTPVGKPHHSVPVTAAEIRPGAAEIELGGAGAEPVDEDSIEAYMNRLLQRVGGSTGRSPAFTAPTTHTVEPTPLDDSASEDPTPATLSAAEGEREEPAAAVADVSPYVPRSQAPERSSNLAAMRELANDSARSAIAQSIRKRAVTQKYSKFAFCGAAVVAGLAMLISGGFRFDHWFLAACCCFSLALFFLLEAVGAHKRLQDMSLPAGSNR